MKSKLNILGHPTHPMLIPLPVAFAIGSLVGDIVAMVGGSPQWYFLAYVLTIGTWATGLLAAIPGLLDYFYVIPKKTRPKRDATVHMILNIGVVGCFFASWLIKNATGGPRPSWTSLILEIIAVCLLAISGWFGWTLVYKHRVGIDEPGLSPIEERLPIRKVG